MELQSKTSLSFVLTLKDGTTIGTVGDAAKYVSGLIEEERTRNYWQVAIRMINLALKEPTYLKTATMCLQSALMLSRQLASPNPLDAQ
jgi:hypothetical protein